MPLLADVPELRRHLLLCPTCVVAYLARDRFMMCADGAALVTPPGPAQFPALSLGNDR